MNATATRRILATIERIPGRRAAIIDLHDANGVWCGSSLIEARFPYRLHPGAPSKAEQDNDHLYELGYQRAEFGANAHGGILDRYGWV